MFRPQDGCDGSLWGGTAARYKPFGGYAGAKPVNYIQNRGFTGHDRTQADDALGVVYMNARVYMPSTGKFLTPDTLVPDPANSQSYNRYAYVHNNPINATDPSGHAPWEAVLCRNRQNVMASAARHNVHPTFLGLIIATEYGWGLGEASKNNMKMAEAYGLLLAGQTDKANAVLRDTTLGVANISVDSAMLMEDLGYVDPNIRSGYGGDWGSREWSVASALHTNEAISIEYTAAYLQYLGDQVDSLAVANGVTLTQPIRDSLIAQGYKSGWVHSPNDPSKCSVNKKCGIGDQLNAGVRRGIDPQTLAESIALTGYAPDKLNIPTSSSGYIWSVFREDHKNRIEEILGYCSNYMLPALYVPK